MILDGKALTDEELLAELGSSESVTEAPSVSEVVPEPQTQEGAVDPLSGPVEGIILSDEEVMALPEPKNTDRAYTDQEIMALPEEPSQVTNEQAYLLDADVYNDPELLEPIRQYMVKRKGIQWQDRTPEEVLDGYKTHMRTVSAGEFTLVGEIQATNRYNDAEKANALQAYTTYEQLAPFYEQGLEEGAEALWDYASAALNPFESPTTLLSIGIGKAITTTIAKPVAAQAIKAALKSGGKAAASKLIADKARNNILKGVTSGALLDSAVGAATDIAYQNEFEKELGAREEYDPLQTAATAGIGFAIPFGLGAIGQFRKGKGVGITKEVAAEARRKAKLVAQKAAAPKLARTFAQLAPQMSDVDWSAAKASGKQADLKTSQRNALTASFFDVNDPNSVVNILTSSGVKLRFEEGKFTNNIVEYIKTLPAPQKAQIDQAWSTATNGQNFDDALDSISHIAADSGEEMAQLAKAKQALEEWYLTALQSGKPVKADDVPPQYMKYAQSTWKRLLVSHPATTAVNIQGWTIATLTRDASHVVQTALTATYNPKQAFRMAKALTGRAKMFADVMGATELFSDVLKNSAPKNVKGALDRETFGGVSNKSPAAIHGMPDNLATRGIEGYSNWASRLTLVDAQDQLTRAFSGMSELDRQVQIKFGKSYAQLVRDGKEHLIDDKIWERVVKTSLQDSFSFDYARSKQLLSPLADAVQKVSNTPGLGFLFPFGKFMNNTVAFTLEHSPLAVVPFARHLTRKEGYEATEALSKGIVGTVALGMLADYATSSREEGFQWNQIENSAGNVRDVQNLAPASQYILGGEMWSMIQNGDTPDADMWNELAKQLAVGEFADIGNTEGVKLAKSLAQWLGSTEEGAAEARSQVGGQLLKMMGGVGSGFTRPLDVINDMVGSSTGNDATTNRRMAKTPEERGFLELTRYTDALLAPIMGEAEEPGEAPRLGTSARSITRPEGAIREPNTLGAIGGAKQAQPMRYLDRALGLAGIAPFTMESRTAVPEFDRFVNGTLAPRVDLAMKNLLITDTFKKANNQGKGKLIKNVISSMKDTLLDEVEEGVYGIEPIIADQRRLFSMKPKVDKAEALEVFGFDGNVRELSIEQLQLMNEYIRLKNEEVIKPTVDAVTAR